MTIYNKVPTNYEPSELEKRILKFWGEHNCFETRVTLNQGKEHWSFIDGPITANNPMGVHHAWGRTYKDLYQRFWAMKGRELRYQNGFDCQGLWVEVEVEKELGFNSKRDIEAYGIAEFIKRCKQRVLNYAAVQVEQSIRLGYWMDWDDTVLLRKLANRLEKPEEWTTVKGRHGPISDSVEQLVGRLGAPELGGSYFTFSNENNYTIWAALKKCHEHGWIYKGRDVMPWCPRCSTALSQHEIATEGYRELTHLSPTLKFPLQGRPKESLLVWTTTPWTLTANVAAAVHPNLTYVKALYGDEAFYLAEAALNRVFAEKVKVLQRLKGREMEGWKYVGPFDELPAEQESGAKDAHRIILWGEVSELEGTGIVHIAPGCGKEDFELSKKFGLPQVVPLDEFGIFVEGFGWLTGKHVYKTQHLIVEDLRSKGLLFKVEDYIHRYPVCWRCSSELVFRVVDEWFISMGEKLDKPLEEVTDDDKEKNLRYQVINSAKEVRWIPSFGLQQELNWLLNMSDWMISKKRYWGLVLPIWECQKCGNFEVIGSEEELRERAVEGWEEFKGHTPHRPWVDAVKIRCPKCGSIISRIPDVGNPWLDAGIIAYSTLNYRHDRRYWKSWFPADLITECWPGQFRNWFYSMLTMSTIMERKTPFRTCLGHGLVLAEDGREMHKSWGNVIWFDDAVEKMGADIMRWMYCKTRPENNVLFGYTKAEETRRQFFVLLWNIYRFFVTYANFDEWTTDQTSENFSLLDRWILSKLQNLVRNITVSLEECAAAEATSHFEDFVGVLSTWYIRRSRRRFRKNKADEDKKAAYTTLYTCLTTLIKLLAPFLPFITEEMYQNLVLSINFDAPVSIHHHDWPREEPALTENQLVENMDLVIRASSLGRAVRSISGVKLRHPLREAMIVAKAEVLKRLERFTDLIRDELNVRRVSLTTYEQALIKYDVKLLPSKLGKKYGAMFPKLEEAIAQIPIEALVSALQERKSVDVKIGTGVVTLLPDEIEIQKMAREGYEIAEEEGLLVGLDMVIDEELAIEGLVRDIVRRIQNQRKDAGLEFADCAEIYFQADPRLAKAFKAHEDYIAKETLSIAIHNKPPPERAYVADYNLGGESLRIGLVRLDTQGTGSKLGRVNLRSN